MAYESFYGGRRGVNFQIVARFDGIDIPQTEGNYVYKRKNYAYKLFEGDTTRYFIYPFIERNASTYTDQRFHWGSVLLDGGNIMTVGENATSAAEAVSRSLGEPQLAKGMVQCFSQGGATTDEVNYGEYVIIDTVADRNEYSNPDNGKIYQRGMDYIVTDQNPLAGAVYIGCVIGPQGNTSKMTIKGYNEVKDIETAEESSYFMSDGLVPGKTDDGYNDDIKVVYATIRDSEGNIEDCTFAFEFPYLVEEHIGRSISPYGDDDHVLPADYELAERLDDESHPFYEKWRFNIPKGIHGDDISKWRFEPTVNRPGAEYWLRDDEMDTEPPEGILNTSYDIVAINSKYLTVEADGISVYIKPSDGWKYKVKYTVINYDNIRTGERSTIVDDLSNYDVLNKIDLAEDGTVTAHYTNRESEPLDNQIQWIDHIFINTDGEGASAEEGNGDQKIHVVYNTDTTEDTAIGRPLNYIIDSIVTEEDAVKNPDSYPSYHMLVYYSDPEKRSSDIAYYSPKKDKIVTGWVDMGYVRGPVEGLRIICEVNEIEDLYIEAEDRWLKPEEVLDDPALGEKMAGWGVTDSDRFIWVYDYKTTNRWYTIGSIDASLVDVSKIFTITSEADPAPSGMGKHGIWATYSEIKYAE